MNRLRTCISHNITLATLVLAGLLLCTIHLDAQSTTIAADHHTAPHTAQCIDTCIDHVPAVPAIHARMATTVTTDSLYPAPSIHSIVPPSVTVVIAVPDTAYTPKSLSKLYLHFSVLRV